LAKRWKRRRAGRPRGSFVKLKRAVSRGRINQQPTPEFIEKRLALAGAGDPKLCGYPLGVMVARGWITRGDHDAGMYYANLYRRKNGSVTPTSVNIEDGGRAGSPPGEHGRFLRGIGAAPEYQAAKCALLQCGRGVVLAVEAVAVFESLGAAFTLREPARRGLARLKRHFRHGR
jgi:hypothetical protein